jgi:hypothetical protein
MESSIPNKVKVTLASLIIVTGGYGYMRFFESSSNNLSIWLIIALFITLETSLLIITTKLFQNIHKISTVRTIGVWIGILIMWILASIGIDQTIWSLVEEKYSKSSQLLVENKVNIDTKHKYMTQIKNLEKMKEKELLYISKLQKHKNEMKKLFNSQTKNLMTIIFYGGKRCDLSTDCTSRKIAQELAIKQTNDDIDLTLTRLNTTTNSIANIDEKIKIIEVKLEHITTLINTYTRGNKALELSRVQNTILLNKLTEGAKSLGLVGIQSPERAYVLLMSFTVYPIYILLIISTIERKEDDYVYLNKKELEEYNILLTEERNNAKI